MAVKAYRDYLVETGKFGTFAVDAQTRLEAVAVILADLVRSVPAFDARSVRTWSVRVLVPCEVPLQGSVS